MVRPIVFSLTGASIVAILALTMAILPGGDISIGIVGAVDIPLIGTSKTSLRQQDTNDNRKSLRAAASPLKEHLARMLGANASNDSTDKCNQQCEGIVIVDDEENTIKATNLTSCIQGISRFLIVNVAIPLIYFVQGLPLFFRGFPIAVQCILNIGQWTNDAKCEAYFRTLLLITQASAIFFLILPINLIYGVITCGQKPLIRRAKSVLLKTAEYFQNGNHRMLTATTTTSMKSNSEVIVERFLTNQIVTTTTLLLDDLNQNYLDDSSSKVNFHDVARRVLQSSLQGVTVRNIPTMLLDQYKTISFDRANTTTNTTKNTTNVSDEEILILFEMMIASMPMNENDYDAPLLLDFTDDEFLQITKISSSYFELYNTNFENDRSLQKTNGTLKNNCAVQDQLLCIAQTVVSSLIAGDLQNGGK